LQAPPTPEPVDNPRHLQRFDVTRCLQEIASLEAQHAEERQEYANRPRIHDSIARLDHAGPKGPLTYKDACAAKVERIGNQNYPPKARDNAFMQGLRMLVPINRRMAPLREIQSG